MRRRYERTNEEEAERERERETLSKTRNIARERKERLFLFSPPRLVYASVCMERRLLEREKENIYDARAKGLI